MLLLLYGEETYRLQQTIKEVKEDYQKKYKQGLIIEEKDALLMTFQELKDFFFQQSFFAECKLVFLDNLFLNPVFEQAFLKEGEKFAQAKDVLVLLHRGELPDKKSLEPLEKIAEVQQFKPLTKKQLESWFEKESQDLGLAFSDEAKNFFLDALGNDLWRLANEIKKTAAYKQNSGSHQVETKELKRLLQPELEDNLFKTIDALANKNKKKALRLIQENILKKNNAGPVLAMIIFQFRGLLLAKSFQARGGGLNDFIALGLLKPFPARKCWYAANNFSHDQLKKVYQKIFEIDLGIKQGRIDQTEGLKMLVTEI